MRGSLTNNWCNSYSLNNIQKLEQDRKCWFAIEWCEYCNCISVVVALGFVWLTTFAAWTSSSLRLSSEGSLDHYKSTKGFSYFSIFRFLRTGLYSLHNFLSWLTEPFGHLPQHIILSTTAKYTWRYFRYKIITMPWTTSSQNAVI